MLPACAKLVPAMLCLASGASPPARQPSPVVSLLSARPFPSPTARLTVSPLTFSAGGGASPVLRLSNSTELTGGRILTSAGLTIRYSFHPGVSIGIGPSVSRLDTPEGRVRAFEGVAFLRFSF
jgi:hypothetical protein